MVQRGLFGFVSINKAIKMLYWKAKQFQIGNQTYMEKK